MAAREQQGRDIDQGVVQRVIDGVRYAVSGVRPDSWFGPAQPLAPVAQDKVEGRRFDYPVGFNLRLTPRGEEAVSFAQLRGLADGYDLLRLIIETRKDQIASFEWEIVPRDKDDSADKHVSDIKRVSDFLERPDKENTWDQWLRMQLEDLLVIDTIAVYPRKNRGDGLYALELVDGATLKRVLDDGGRTPLPPDPAYQQILKGVPAADYSRDQLVYMMRNPRTNRIYGFSPVEQVITTVNIALRRQLSQLQFYTEGNVPEALAQVPETWTSKQVAEFQTWWDSVMEGNLAARRKMRFVPSLKDIVFPKQGIIKDEYDEWLARIVCFAFSISPSALIKQVNRASGEQMADTAKEEGLLPLQRFLETHITYLIQRYLDAPHLRFAWKIINRVSPVEQAKVHATYVSTEVMTPDEVREDLGMDAMPEDVRRRSFPMPLPFNQAILQEGGEHDELVPAFEGPDGKPKPGGPSHASGGGGTGVEKPVGVVKAMSAAERMLYEKVLPELLRVSDPERLAKIARELAPRVVEVRPEVNVEVGDTNVHMPAPVVKAPPAPLAKAAEPVKLHAIRTRRMADGSALTTVEEKES